MHMSEDNSNKELNCLVPVIKPGGQIGQSLMLPCILLKRMKLTPNLCFEAFKSSRGSQLGLSEDLV